MRVLIVCRQRQGISPFITEQVDALAAKGIDFEYFFIKGKGAKAYLLNFRGFKNYIRVFKPDVIHAHYGLSGFFSNWQRKIPVVTTYHGGDINYDRSRPLSKLSIRYSKLNIFVSDKLAKKAGVKKKFIIQPCGINLDVFRPINKKEARQLMKLRLDRKYVLFSSAFSNPIKNASLAREVISLANSDINLIELKGYTREQVMLLLNACDVALLTSFMEGSPQFIKEAMACNCPIVSTNVGSVEEIINGTAGCYIASFEPEDIANKLKMAIEFGKRTNGHQKITCLDNNIIAERIISAYKTVLS